MGVFAGCLSDEPESIERWLLDAENYEGTIEDKTGTKSVAVTVGPEKEATSVPSPTSGNETHQQSSTENEYTFAPAAIKISPETTVTWKWEGRGGEITMSLPRTGSLTAVRSSRAALTSRRSSRLAHTTITVNPTRGE